MAYGMNTTRILKTRVIQPYLRRERLTPGSVTPDRVGPVQRMVLSSAGWDKETGACLGTLRAGVAARLY